MLGKPTGGSVVYEPGPKMVRLAPWLLAAVGISVSLLLFWTLRAAERAKLASAVDLEGAKAVGSVESELGRLEELLRSVISFVDASEKVELDEFRTYSRRGLSRDASVRALLWFGSNGTGLSGYELEHAAGPEATSDRVRTQLLDRPEVSAALAWSGTSRSVIASAPLMEFVPGGMPRLFVALPRLVDERVVGFVGALIDVQRVVERSGVLESEWGFQIEDLGGAGAERAEAVRYVGPSSSSDLRHVAQRPRWGRSWQLTSVAPEDAFEGTLTWWPPVALANGLLLTAMLVGTVAMATNRRRLQWLVDRRTRDIQAAYDTLAEEAERRIAYMMEARALEKQMREIIDLVPYRIYVKDWYGRYLLANEATARSLGTTVDALTATGSIDFDHDLLAPDKDLLEDRELMEHGLSSIRRAVLFTDADGKRRILHEIKAPFTGLPDERRALLCVTTDVTERHHAERTLEAQNRLLEQLAQGGSPKEVLRGVIGAAEEIVPGMRASILLVTPDGEHLTLCHAPSLPEFYNDAVEGIEIGPTAGSCGAAAHSGELMVVEDVMEHPNWAPYREIATQAGLRACWSQPIRTPEGTTLGTFAMYYAEQRAPEPYELDFMRAMAHLAMIAIERSRSESNL